MRVAVTRPKERVEETAALIRKRGWKPLVVPSIQIVPRSIAASVKLEDYDWLVVTSASGADVLCDHFHEHLKEIDIGVVGPKTKAAFVKKGVTPTVVASEHVGEGLAAELQDKVRGKRVLVARAAIARKGLVEELKKIAQVTEIAIYDTVMPADRAEMVLFKKLIKEGGIDAVIFTSSRATKNLIEFLGTENAKRLNEIIVCAIGPVTARTVEDMGVKITCTPKKHTLDAALDEISRHI